MKTSPFATTNNWIPLDQVPFDEPAITLISVDTRDFHCLIQTEEQKVPDYETLKKYPKRFFCTPDEVKAYLTRYYEETGGRQDWRFLLLTNGRQEAGGGWQFKYFRIYKTPLGFIFFGGNKAAIKKEILNWKAKTSH